MSKKLAMWKVYATVGSFEITAHFCAINDDTIFFYVDSELVATFYLPNIIGWFLQKDNEK